MSSTAPIPDTAEVFINWSVHGELLQNAVYFRSLSPPVTQAKLDTLRGRVFFSMLFNFLSTLGAGTILRSIDCMDRSPTSGLTSSILIGASSFNPVIALPSSIALGLKHWVFTPTEVHPSRTFVPGIPADKVTGNLVDPVWAEHVRGLWSTNMALPGSFGWRYVRVSLYAAGVPRSLGVTSDINGTSLQSARVSMQRRRQPGQ